MRNLDLKLTVGLALVAALLSGSPARANSIPFATSVYFSTAGNDLSTGTSVAAFCGATSVTASYLPSVGFFAIPSVRNVGSAARFAIGALSINPFDYANRFTFDPGDHFQDNVDDFDSSSGTSASEGNPSFNSMSGLDGWDNGAFGFDLQANGSEIDNAAGGHRYRHRLENTIIKTNTKGFGGGLYLDFVASPGAIAAPADAITPLPRTVSMGLALFAVCGLFAIHRRLMPA